MHNRTGQACPRQGLVSDKPLSWTKGQAADAHLKGHGLPSAAVVAVTSGRLDGFALLAEIFGTWARIFYGGFDGRRHKRVLVKIVGE